MTNPKSYRQLLEQVPRDEWKKSFDDCRWEESPSFHFIGYDQRPTFIEGFRDHGSSQSDGYSVWKFEGEREVGVDDVIKGIVSVLTQVTPNIAPGRFQSIPLWDFYSSYAFNDDLSHVYLDTKAEQLFKARFDIG